MIRRGSALLVLLLAWFAAACSRPVPGDPVSQAFAASAGASADGEIALAEGDLARAAAAFGRAAEAAAEVPDLDPWRRICLYNLACAEARRGERPAALAAFRASLEGGLPLGAVVVGGETVLPPDALLLEHVLADPDLDSIRGEAAYAEALRPYVAAGEAWFHAEGRSSDLRSAILVLRGDGDPGAEGAAREWIDGFDAPRWQTVGLAGPVRCGDGSARWILRDGDTRWAVARIRRAIEEDLLEPAGGATAVHLVGDGPDAATAAWAAVLAFPERVAGFAVRGVRFLRAADEDALTAAARARRTPWVVVLGACDSELAQALRDHGIEPAVVPDDVPLADAARSAWR